MLFLNDKKYNSLEVEYRFFHLSFTCLDFISYYIVTPDNQIISYPHTFMHTVCVCVDTSILLSLKPIHFFPVDNLIHQLHTLEENGALLLKNGLSASSPEIVKIIKMVCILSAIVYYSSLCFHFISI